MRKALFLLGVLALAVAAPVHAAGVGGTWALSMSGPQGDENFDIVITDDGGSLKVTTTHPMLQEMVGTGTLQGDDINFSIKATGQMAVEMVFTGKVAGKKMEGTREIKMAAGGQGAPGGGQGPPSGGGAQGGPPAGGGQGGPPSGGAPSGGAPSGGAPGGGAPGGGGDMSSISNAWSAAMK